MNNLKLMDLSSDTRKTVQKGFGDTYASSYSSGEQDNLNDFGQDTYLKSHKIYDEDEEMDDYQLEEDYIMKLKTQRQRIEKLEKATNQKDQLLLKQIERSKQLLQQIDRLNGFVPFKQQYEDLLMEKQQLERQYEKMYIQLKDVKQQLSQVIKDGTSKSDKLKRQLHDLSLKNRQILQESEQRITEKADEIKNLKNMLKNLQMDHQKQLKNYKADHEKLVHKLEDTIYTLQKQCHRFKLDIKNRDQAIGDLEKALDSSKKNNLQLKSYMQKYSDQVQQRQKQLYQQLNKSKHNLSQIKKSNQELKTEIHDLETMIKKVQQQKQDACINYDELKADFRKANQIYESTLKKKQYEFNQEMKHSNLFIEELKSSIEDLMEVKNSLLIENKKQMAILKRKQQIERQRKQILRTQFKQINRIEKVIDRLQ